MTPPINGTHTDVLDVTEDTAERVTLAKTGDTGTVTTAPPTHNPGDTEPVSLDKPEGATETATEGAGGGKRGPGGLPPLAGGPLVPEWMRDVRSSTTWALRYLLHVLGFHGIRLPIYLARTCGYTPRGIVRASGALGRWALDAESRPLRQAANDAHLFTEYDRLDRARKEKVKTRVPVALVTGCAVAALVFAGVTAGLSKTIEDAERTGVFVEQPGNPWITLATVLAVVLVAGWHGRSPDRPLVESAVVSTPKARRLTGDTVTNAFVAARLAKLPDHPPTFWSRVHRDGAGWGAVVDLPIGYGKTADDAIAARKKIAAALVVDEGRLFLARSRGDGGSAGRVNFWLADTDPLAGPAPKSPLVALAEIDLWSPVPFGVDERGRTIKVNLLWTSFGFAGVPGAGKTASVRNLAAAAALDPFADLGVFDGKGEGGLSVDWDAVRELAEAYGAGDDDETARQLLAYAEGLVKEMNRRSGAIASLPRAQRRDGKLTRKLARSRTANMRIKVLIVDEVQDFIGDDVNGPYRDRLRAALTKLVKRGRFVGIVTVVSTQKLDVKAIPSTIRDNLGSRFGLRVTTTVGNDMALGAGAREMGYDATSLLAHHLGTGFLLGTAVPKELGANGVLVRSNYIDLEQFERICARGRELRIEHGTLIGLAAGEEIDASTVSLIDDIARAWPAGTDDMWNEEIVTALDDTFPGRYAYDAKSLGVTLAGLGVTTVQITRPAVNGGRARNRKGLRIDQVGEAIAEQADARRAAAESDDDTGASEVDAS